MSTAKGGGNMVFKILKGGAKDVPNAVDNVQRKTGGSPASTTDLDAETDRPRLKGPGAKASRRAQEPKTDAGTLGRERRK
jgi:hypothetical protein